MEKSNPITSIIWCMFAYFLIDHMVDLINNKPATFLTFLAIAIETYIVSRDLNRYGIINLIKGLFNK